ncbi:hypothetical protein AAFF_G00315530 [Aldrovandia affinis]|uniref:Uncharacterized protein n=1 Tax=Aldrovandia affinis TaxID=143900 RepID=A0AAD7SNU0_9TELE|nr:hypothetical protein AAFF_G00315530 [Aldrovandia affinis]
MAILLFFLRSGGPACWVLGFAQITAMIEAKFAVVRADLAGFSAILDGVVAKNLIIILSEKAEDQENRLRRDNVRILGSREGAEGKDPLKFFEKQDFSVTVRKKRGTFNEACQMLIEKNVRFGMNFPATLAVTREGQTHLFRSPVKALAFAKEIS